MTFGIKAGGVPRVPTVRVRSKITGPKIGAPAPGTIIKNRPPRGFAKGWASAPKVK